MSETPDADDFAGFWLDRVEREIADEGDFPPDASAPALRVARLRWLRDLIETWEEHWPCFGCSGVNGMVLHHAGERCPYDDTIEIEPEWIEAAAPAQKYCCKPGYVCPECREVPA